MSDQPINNAEPLKYSLDFEIFFKDVFNSFAGMKSNLKKLDEGNYVVEYEIDENASPIGNANGGNHVVANLRLMMNRHGAFGNLKQDEIADICGNVMKATINPMFVFMNRFGITSEAMLENFGLNLFESLYTFLTSIKETKEGGQGGMMAFGERITSVVYQPKPAVAETQKGLY